MLIRRRIVNKKSQYSICDEHHHRDYTEIFIFLEFYILKACLKSYLKYYRKKISISIKNTGIRQLSDQNIYPKKDGILIPFSSAIERTIKFGALPI